MLLLRDKVDRRRVEDLAEKDVEALAPSLGAVIRDLLYREEEHIKQEASVFVAATVPTENLKRIVGEVFEALREGRTFAKWLNLDMGSGKTHLLTFLLYALHAYDALAEYLREHKWIDAAVARRTAVFAADLRTPGEVIKYLLFFAKSLEKVGEVDAARYVRDRAMSGQFPDAKELAAKLRRGDTRIAIIVDELYHGVLTYRETEDRSNVARTISFVMQMMDYMRNYKRPLAILVASARRDYEDAVAREDLQKDSLLRDANRLIEQLARLEPVLETRWLSVEEARQIILRKLGAKQDIFHKLFDRFIERVIKADSDIPQAHHLRSLIKAMAIFTKNAIENGRSVVTPADFSEAVLTALFAGDGGLAVRYKSAYDTAMREVEMAQMEVREPLMLAINTIFSLSVTGRPDQLIEVMKAYKTGRYDSRLLPAVSEREMRELLMDLGSAEVEIQNSLSLLDSVPYVHSVKGDAGYVYFVVPVESVVAIYNKYIEDEFKRRVADSDWATEFLTSSVKTAEGRYGNVHLVVVNSYDELETRGLSPDAMNIFVYAGAVNEDIAKKLERWLLERRMHNLAVVLPSIDGVVVKHVARFMAIYSATSKIVSDYLQPYLKSQAAVSDKVAEYMKRLIDLEVDEINRVVTARLEEAVKSISSAVALAFRRVYIYTCKTGEAGLTCSAELDEVNVEPPSVRIFADVKEYSRLLDILDRRKQETISTVLKALGDAVKTRARFVDSESTARDMLVKYVADAIKKGSVELSKDMNVFPYGGEIYYIPPAVLSKAIQTISKDAVAKAVGTDVVQIWEGDVVRFELAPAVVDVVEPPPVQKAEEVDKLTHVINEMMRRDNGRLVVILRFSKENKSMIKSQLLALKRHIEDIELHD